LAVHHWRFTIDRRSPFGGTRCAGQARDRPVKGRDKTPKAKVGAASVVFAGEFDFDFARGDLANFSMVSSNAFVMPRLGLGIHEFEITGKRNSWMPGLRRA
jgi:hypothetical protein